MGQSARVKSAAWSTVLGSGFVALAACSGVRWVTITEVAATDTDSTTLTVFIDACTEVPPPRVIETESEVHVLIDLKFDYSQDQKSCMSGAEIQLESPIGTRTVINDRHHTEIGITWYPTLTPPPVIGSVNNLIGQEGSATVTGWLVIDESGSAAMCDNLVDTATRCTSPFISIDWATGNAEPPTDLLARGTSSVSDGPITLTGSLKGNILFVGVEF